MKLLRFARKYGDLNVPILCHLYQAIRSHVAIKISINV